MYIRKTGKNPGFDPLKIMVSVAHDNGMKIEAWINPYRVSSGSTSYKALSSKNQARKWHNKKSTRRNVLAYQGNLYYNPAKPQVRKLIINGVKEIVKNYEVDGIHMDDYFYPSFTSYDVNSAFDAKEYRSSAMGKNKTGIAAFRREQVSTLVKNIHSAIKAINPDVTFGISPAGNLDNLTSDYAYYVDIYKWLDSTDYVDYICPQIYWGFNHPTASFDKMTNRWMKAAKSKKVKVYIALPFIVQVTAPGQTHEKSANGDLIKVCSKNRYSMAGKKAALDLHFLITGICRAQKVQKQ